MSFIKKIFGKKEDVITNYETFWVWFQQHEKNFFDVVKKGNSIEKDFFDKLSLKLSELNEGFYFLSGMCDDSTAELILTPDGIIKNIVFIEELINAAPSIPRWKFTALKPPCNIDNIQITMGDYIFDSASLSFYSNDHNKYPDEIDIVIIHRDYKEEDKSLITNGTYIFIDNFIGELNAITAIDNLVVIDKSVAQKELIPIEKLKPFLIWREKEFIERYESQRYDTANDSYSSLEAKLNNDKPLIAIVNTTLLEWDGKASHPWILKIDIKYNGNSNGFPENDTYAMMNSIEDEIIDELRDFDGYLYIGRQTADNLREIYFACKDYRKPSKVVNEAIKRYKNLNVDYEIYKDKYWQSFEKFRL